VNQPEQIDGTNTQTRQRGVRLGPSERRLLLILGDFLVAVIATLIALALWAQFDWYNLSSEFLQKRAGWFSLIPFIWILLMANLYDLRRASSMRESMKGVLFAAMLGTSIYLTVYFFRSSPESLPRRGILYFLLIVVVLTLLWRAAYVRVFNAPAFRRRILLIGAGRSGKALLDVLLKLQASPFEVVGMIDDDPQLQDAMVNDVPVLGDSSVILDIIEREGISDVFVAVSGKMNGEMFQTLLDAQENGVSIVRMPVAYEELLGRVPIHHLESDWLLRSFVDEVRVGSFYHIFKRFVDLMGALVGLLVLALIYPWVALAILLDSGRPVLFYQTRLGKGGKKYELAKFRTMSQDAEADGVARWTADDDPRTTKVGRFLRKTHIDELPQFINVLVGDMSIAGPRPERPELVAQLEKEIPFYRARLLVKPGISGWAQVNYGKGASVRGSAEKLEFDLYYIKHRSFWLDLWIIFRSIGEALGFQGV
jgi:exopolysaccharide biosynthesis polyprenyl glycosylphosphotransferase